jgi:hypothetical protein
MEGSTTEIFLAACEQVAADSRLGEFKWLKSKRELTKCHEDLSHSIYLQTSRLNEVGRSVTMGVVVSVRSHELEGWRRETGRPAPQNDFVAGCSLSYLMGERSIRRWNVWGDGFVHSVREVRQLLASFALPFFDAFDLDPSKMFALPEWQITHAFMANPSSLFERLVQLDRLDLVSPSVALLPPKMQKMLRRGYEKREAEDDETIRFGSSYGGAIFELGLGYLLGWNR